MNLSKMVEDLESRMDRSARPWMRIAAAVVLLLGLLGTTIFWQVNSRSQIMKRRTKASAQFGEALLKAGIPTQAGPGK